MTSFRARYRKIVGVGPGLGDLCLGRSRSGLKSWEVYDLSHPIAGPVGPVAEFQTYFKSEVFDFLMNAATIGGTPQLRFQRRGQHSKQLLCEARCGRIIFGWNSYFAEFIF